MRPKKTAAPEGLMDLIGDAYSEFRRKRVVIQPDDSDAQPKTKPAMASKST